MRSQKLYHGNATDHSVAVRVSRDGGFRIEALEHRVRHSPTGLRWGYAGSGPADLARSILFDHLKAEPATAMYQAFKVDFVSKWGTEEDWYLSSGEIEEWIGRYKQGLAT